MHTYGTIRTNAYYMIGLPTETRAEMFDTIELCRRINSKVNSVSIFQPFPGQALTRFCIQEGYISGREPCASFTSHSILKQPHIAAEEISGIWRTFMLYAKLPKSLWPAIEKCEKDPTSTAEYQMLVRLRWDLEKYGTDGHDEIWHEGRE